MAGPNGSHDQAVPLNHRSYAYPSASRPTASATVAAPDGTATPTPRRAAAAAIPFAAVGETRPAGIGLPGLRPASLGASIPSLSAPTGHWSRITDSPRPN